MRTAKVLFLTLLGCGLSPWAPGTVGSLGALVLYLLLVSKFSAFARFLFLVLVFSLGVVWGAESAKLFGEEDNPRIVIDEAVGMWVSLLGLPLGFWSVVNAFLLFRFFDIYKPGYMRELEKLPGGWGVMVDDLVAGVIVNILLRAIFG